MAIEFDGDVIVVTGGAGGLGSAYCRLLAGLGARVVVNDTGGVVDGTGGNPDAAAAVVRDIEAGGGTAIADTGDGSKADDAQALIAKTLDAFGRIDAVVANAGILRDRGFHNVTDEDFFAVVNAHLAGTVRVFHAAYPHMREQGYGRLVSTTSGSGLFGNFGQTSYAAAKLGIAGFTRSLAIEGAKRDVKANVVAPMARTRMTEDMVSGAFAERLNPDNVAPLVAYLCHPSLDFTGNIISAGAGRFARVRIGVSEGIYEDEPTPDSVPAALGATLDDERLAFPEHVGAEIEIAARASASDSAPSG